MVIILGFHFQILLYFHLLHQQAIQQLQILIYCYNQVQVDMDFINGSNNVLCSSTSINGILNVSSTTLLNNATILLSSLNITGNIIGGKLDFYIA